MSSATTEPKSKDTRGLAGQTIGDTEICSVGQKHLIYRGYEIADLAEHATFEEVAHVLLVGHKPSPEELSRFCEELAEMRPIAPGLVRLLQEISKDPPAAHPMSLLRTAVSYQSHFDPDVEDNSPEAALRKSKRLLAQIPTMIGCIQRTIDGKEPVEPDPSIGHAANLLLCMSGSKPGETYAKAMDVSLILYAEHDFNASTFTARVIASTESDLHAAVCGAIGALKGPLHGGANEMAMEMLKEVDRFVTGGGTIDQWMQNAFAAKTKIMGFGHRVYKQGDHRAAILRKWGLEIADERGPEFRKWIDIGDRVQAIMLEEKKIHPNVDFPCGMTYFVMDIPVPQYTPIFVASRITGWCAHIMEQHRHNRIIRPLANYTGPAQQKWNG